MKKYVGGLMMFALLGMILAPMIAISGVIVTLVSFAVAIGIVLWLYVAIDLLCSDEKKNEDSL